MASSSSSTLNAASTTRTTLKFTAVTVLVSLASYTLGCVYTPPILSLLYPKPYVWPTELGDPDSLESRQYLATLENQLQSIPLLQQSRKDPTTSAWLEARPYSTVPPDRRVNHLTAGVLNGIGKMAILPLARIRPDQQETWFFVHLGRKLCGHDGIVHGGLIATLLDETLAWTALVNLPEQIGVTASLNIKYRAPTKADQFVVFKTFLSKTEGRKSWVTARVEDLDGNLLVEAEGMFVQPKYAKLLNKKGLHQAMGFTQPRTSAGEKPLVLTPGAESMAGPPPS